MLPPSPRLNNVKKNCTFLSWWLPLLSPHNVNFDDDNYDTQLDGDNDAQLDGDLRISQLKGFDHHPPLHLLIDSYQQQKI